MEIMKIKLKLTELPRRSRRESVKPIKKKKNLTKGCLVTALVLLILFGAGGFFGLSYAKSATTCRQIKQYVSSNSRWSNTQQVVPALEKSGVIKNGLAGICQV